MRIGTAGALAAAAVLTLGTPAAAMTGGARLADPAAAPWMATLAVKGPQPLLDRASCGGVLIGPSRVLTAAHCVDGVDPDQVEVHIGASVFSKTPGTVRDIVASVSHPGYELLPSPVDPDNLAMSSARNDVAVLGLSAPVRGVDHPAIAAHRPAPGAELDFYGHGLTGTPGPSNPDPRADVLRHGTLRAVDHRTCAADTPATVDGRSMLCARDPHGKVTACPGDSGSPLISREHGRPEVAGIMSFAGETAGRQCGEPSVVAFTDPRLLAR